MSKDNALAIVPPATLGAPSLPYTASFIANCEGLDVNHPAAERVAERTFIKNVGGVVREAALCSALASAERTMNDASAEPMRRRAAQLFWTRNTRK